MAEDKIECSEELGDLLQSVDADMALRVYIKAKANTKVVAALAARGEFEKMGKYCEMADYKPDYSYLRKMFKDLFFREGYAYDHNFDWTLKNSNQDKSREHGNPAARQTTQSAAGQTPSQKDN